MKIRSNSYLVMVTFVLVFTLAAVKAEAASLNITLSTSSVTFPDQDPDIFPVTQQNGVPVSITITTNRIKGTSYSCSAQALGDLVDSSFSNIPIANVRWTAVTVKADAGESFYDGTLSKSTPVLVARGQGKDSAASPLQGDLTFFIDNLWTYATGNYAQTVNFTVSIP